MLPTSNVNFVSNSNRGRVQEINPFNLCVPSTSTSHENIPFHGRESILIPCGQCGHIVDNISHEIRQVQLDTQANIIISESIANMTDGTQESLNNAERMFKSMIGHEPREKRNWVARNIEEYTFKNPEDSKSVRYSEFLPYKKDPNQREAKFPPIIKNLYNEDFTISTMDTSLVTYFRSVNNNIHVSRSGLKPIPNPVITFENAFKQFFILKKLHEQGFERPSPIQMQAWPILLRGEDMIGIAENGTGKTLAYLLPALIHVEGQPTPRNKREGPVVLIVVPTRELALQIEKEISKYLYRGIKSVCICSGGYERAEYNVILEERADIVIITPGRLQDLAYNRHLHPRNVSFLVLDEADKLMELGFEVNIRKALFGCRPDRQTAILSATWQKGISDLAVSIMVDPVYVNVGSLNLSASQTVKQELLFVRETDKEEILLRFLKTMNKNEKLIVFCGTRLVAFRVNLKLALLGINSELLHGQLDYEERAISVRNIEGEGKILIATDVAARGLDFKDITYVINFDFPKEIAEYVHRIGRTGRAGKTGTAISYLTAYDGAQARALIHILKEAKQNVPIELEIMAERYEQMRKRDSFVEIG